MFMTQTQPTYALELSGFAPDPDEMWERMTAFLLLDAATTRAMQRTSEVLLAAGAEFIVGTYNYLAQFEETAAVLGWEQKMDEAHLAERRQFFATWMGRTIGVDFSDEFAAYLFNAGRWHAGHGPRAIHTPDMWIVGSIGHVQAHFARCIVTQFSNAELASKAIGGWNKYLNLQLWQMLAGYRVALAVDDGPTAVEVRLFGRLRDLAGREKQMIRTYPGAAVRTPLIKFFDYYPRLRRDILVPRWVSPEDNGAATWTTDFKRVFTPREGPDWRLLLNGKDLRFHGGLETPVQAGDVLSLFPPGR
ncbi:MAG: hypothetical protein HUU23_15275 [Caldilineales bacterium]|nr:hypothetical protein [Caldilineales bacterium]